jgi:hypothetical protein
VDSRISGQLIEQPVERILTDSGWLLADRREAVALEQPLYLSEVRGRGRIVGGLDNREAERRRAAIPKNGGSALNVSPDRIRDRASLERRCSQRCLPM